MARKTEKNKIEKIQELLDEAIREASEQVSENEMAHLKGEIDFLKKENSKLESELKRNPFTVLSGKKIDILTIMDSLGLFESNDISYEMGNVRALPNEFLAFIKYYEYKNLFFAICEGLGINLESWYKSFVIPYEWEKKTVLDFLKNIDCQYVCNGKLFGGNLAFWYHEGLIGGKTLTINRQYTEIPWQFVLRNPLFSKDPEVFNTLLTTISKQMSNSQYLFAIQKYQELSEYQKEALALAAATVMSVRGRRELGYYNDITLKEYFPKSEETVLKLFHFASDNQYDTLYIGRFPLKYQIEFIKSIPNENARYQMLVKLNILTKENLMSVL